MKIYNYLPVTGEYISEAIADIDPEETRIQGTEIYLIPANATSVEPDLVITDNEVACFNGSEWLAKPDFRGKKYYDKTTGADIIISEIGPIPDNLQDTPKPKTLAELKTEAHAENTKRHLTFQKTPFVYTLIRDNGSSLIMYLDCTDDTCFNLDRAIGVADKTGDAPFYDGLGNGSGTRFSVAELDKVFNAIQNKLKPSFDKKGQAKLDINMATSAEELENILASLVY